MKITYGIIVSFLIVSCVSPSEAFKKKNYKQAFNLASKEIKRGKNTAENISILKASSEILVNREMNKNQSLVRSNKVKDWKKVQNRYYNLLEDIGAINISLEGEVSESYDRLCSAKKDLDYQIADKYYEEGNKYYDLYFQDYQKLESRNAYFKYKECRKQGGHIYFRDIDDLMKETHERGIVYYDASGVDFGNNFFLKRLPKNADFEPDCVVGLSKGWVQFSEEESSKTKDYKEEIVVGKEAVTDTSGQVTYHKIYKKVEGSVITTIVTVTAYQEVKLNVDNLTGQCTIVNLWFTENISDKYEIIEFIGDERAIPKHIQEITDEPSFFRSHLVEDLEKKIRERI